MSSITLTKKEIIDLHEYATLTDGDPDYDDQEFVIEYKAAGVVKDIDDPAATSPAGYYIAELDAIEEGWTLLGGECRTAANGA